VKKLAKILLGTVALLVLAGYVISQLPAFGGRFDGARLERMRRSPEFIDGRFQNSPPQKTDGAFWETLRLYRQGQIREPQFAIPVIPLSPQALRVPASPGLRAIWFGHSSVLVEIDGVRVMTDPVLSDVVSPIPIGPKRMHPPPIALADLSGIDAVLISHDHYDHLDMQTIQHLASQGTQFYVGLGIGAHLERWQVAAAQIHEMDWWESLELKNLQINCTPARHYSGRKRQDNSTLWASWVVKGAQHSFYFSGDTGYAEHFRAIHARYGTTQLNLIKIGAYGTPPSWLDIHMDPESAIKADQDLGGGILLPVHWATFNLSYHAWDEPILRTLRAAAAEHVQVVTPHVGEVVDVGQPFTNIEWYRRGER
jgi:L-ascorbate metabolism protein UlaG (beta-lactamase superfamily)